jgi:predicted lipoprotein with Yx(FWY)xxD motif
MLFAFALCLLGSLALGCVGYSDTSPPELAPAPSRDASEAELDQTHANDASTHEASAPEAVVENETDAGTTSVEVEPKLEANLRVGHSARFDGYLMDRREQPLYMFAEDVAGNAESACLGACAKQWPPFDLQTVQPERGLIVNEVTRFHRQDGLWQSAYKGHPLYYRNSEAGATEITGDGMEGRWFVARDYLAFISVSMSFAPAGSDSFDAGFLTNGFGRALYVCFDDSPGDIEKSPISSCTGECMRRRPLWSVSEAMRTTILPSVMDPTDISEFVRPDGAVQLLLRGWPVYYFSGDENWGDTQGQNENAWRAIDPVGFGKQVAKQLVQQVEN